MRNTIAMSPLAERIASAVYQNSPRLYCFTCLAAQLRVKEHDVRAVSVVLVVREGHRLVRRVCSGCGRLGESLVIERLA